MQQLKDFFIETFLDALGPTEITKEHDFMSWLISVDGGRHPLLKNLPVVLPRSPEIFTLTENEFLNLREQLLGSKSSNNKPWSLLIIILGVLDNIEQILREEENDMGENNQSKRNIDLFGKYLSNLEDVWSVRQLPV